MRTNSSHINCHGYVLSEVETLPCPQTPQTQRYSQSPPRWVSCRVLWRHATRKRDAAVHRDIADSGSLAHTRQPTETARAWAAGTLSSGNLRRFSSAGIFRVAPPHLQRPATASCLFHITHTTPERRRRTHTISDTHHRHIRTRHRMWCMASLPRST